MNLVIGSAAVGVKPAAPTPLPKAQVKTSKSRHEYVAPKDATEAKQRIEAAIAKNVVIIDSQDGEDPVTFRGATYGLKDCFRLLGGDFDKTRSLWFVPRAAWLDPATATATKSEAMLRKEKDEADREAEVQRRIREAIDADRRLRPTATPEGMMTIEEAKNLIAAGISHALHKLNINQEQLMEIVNQVISDRK